MKPELSIFAHGMKKNVYCVIDAFVHVLDPPRHMYVPLEHFRIIHADKVQQLGDEYFCFLLGKFPFTNAK